MIIMQPEGGLCNRMRTIKAALNLAQKYNHRVKVLWDVNSDLNSDYEELFEKTELFQVKNIHLKGYLKRAYRLFVRKRYRVAFIHQKMIEANNWKVSGFEEYWKETLENPKNVIYLNCCDIFYKGGNIGYEWLVPQPKLQKEVEKIREKLGEYAVGIHIRRTDNTWSIESSPTSLFEAAIKKEIEQNPQVRFFLATDDAQEKQKLLQKFPDYIVTNENVHYTRDSIDGMKDSVVDLFCLANTDKIYGSYWSSFSDEASRINGAELIILNHKSK